jgi:hypothetical protein
MDFFYQTGASDAPAAPHWTILERTTLLMPEAHRSVIDHIELRGHDQAPKSGGGSISAARVIRLSYASLRQAYNRNYNITLLHEGGHHVNWHYGIEAFVRSKGADGAALLNTGHSGATQGAGERIADCYMIYLMQVIARVPYQHPADPTAYRGVEATRRFKLLLQSPAFAGLSGYPEA